MKLRVEVVPSFVGFHTLRVLLEKIGYVPETNLDNIALDLVRPFSDFRSTVDAISLTDGISEDEQLRFFLVERAERRLTHLATDIHKRFELTHCEIGNAHLMDDGSKRFLEILVQLGQCDVTFSSANEGEVHSAVLDEQEPELVSILSGNRDDLVNSVIELTKFARSYLRVGDVWSAERIFDMLQGRSLPTELVRLKAICCVMTGDTFAAENLYLELAERGTNHEYVSANYGLSMLYLRHHPTGVHDVGKARKFLNDAYKRLDSMEASQQAKFQRIFNRNGYALTDFRLGKLDLAAKSLEDGIKKLREIPGVASNMHSSVLIYNLAQCRSAQKKPEQSLSLLEGLVAADPNYPEYRVDLARSLMASGQKSRAKSQLKSAIELDSSMPEAYVVLGNCFDDDGEFEDSTAAYEKAYSFDRSNLGILYSMCRAMSELERFEEVHSLIEPWIYFGQSHENWEDLVALYLESSVTLSSAQTALNALNDIVQKVGTTKNLDLNRQLLEAAC